jgi:uncharacterized Zn finger protein (UPF0148 family)
MEKRKNDPTRCPKCNWPLYREGDKAKCCMCDFEGNGRDIDKKLRTMRQIRNDL